MNKIVSSVALLAIAGNVLMAGGDSAPVEPVVVEELVSDEWKFQFSPMFLWGMHIDGASTIGPTTAPLDLDFSDILNSLSAVFTFHFEATKGDWTYFSELQYVKLTPTMDITPIASMDINFRDYMFELGTGYAFSRSERSKWEGLLGLRYTQQKIKTTLQPVNVGLLDVSNNWIDIFVGLRNTYTISDEWTLLSRADIGAGGSDFVWNAVVMADYRFNDWGSVFFGFKAMDYDYDNDKHGFDHYAYDATQYGPLAGLNIHW